MKRRSKKRLDLKKNKETKRHNSSLNLTVVAETSARGNGKSVVSHRKHDFITN